MYSENSLFLRLLNLVMGNQGGYVVLYNCVLPLYGDADAIAIFYADAEFNQNDPEWTGVDTTTMIAQALDRAGVWIPPYPGTGDDPLAMSPDGKYYADPAAANAHLAALMGADAGNSEALQAVGNESLPVKSNLEPAFVDPLAVQAAMASDQLVALNTESMMVLDTAQFMGMESKQLSVIFSDQISALNTDQISALSTSQLI